MTEPTGIMTGDKATALPVALTDSEGDLPEWPPHAERRKPMSKIGISFISLSVRKRQVGACGRLFTVSRIRLVATFRGLEEDIPVTWGNEVSFSSFRGCSAAPFLLKIKTRCFIAYWVVDSATT